MLTFKGIIGNRGQALGTAVAIKQPRRDIKLMALSEPSQIEVEIQRLEKARNEYRTELTSLYEKTRSELGEEEAGIFLAYLEMVNDDYFFEAPICRIRDEKINIEFALNEEKIQTVQMFSGMDDPYMQERGTDIENVCNALLDKLSGLDTSCLCADQLHEPFILIAEDLTPADTVRLDKTWLKGFITEKGGQTSHTVILAKTLGIPAIVGAKGILAAAPKDTLIWMNGETGEVIFDPSDEVVRNYWKNVEKEKERRALLEKAAAYPAVTKDRMSVKICVNAGQQEEIDCLPVETCDGVGLFRTEFLYMSGANYPSEEIQFQIYRHLAERFGENEVIIRTLDIGGDKIIHYMDMPEEDNPFLGFRAIRICLNRPDIFRTQIRALLRASAYGNLSIMFPMIVSLSELRQAKQIVSNCSEELRNENIPFNEHIRIGVMIETPAAVLISDLLAPEADFFSIGTNDLIQYVTASDRMNEKVQYLYTICDPAVLRAIRTVVENGHRAGIHVGICGEAASDERLIPVWIALQIDKLSMVPSQTAIIKYLIQNFTQKEAEKISEKIFSLTTADEIENYLTEVSKKYII